MAEALAAVTRNAAAATGVTAWRGGWRLVGRPTSVVGTADYRDLAYAFGTNPVAGVMIDGARRPPAA
ncbi:MAG: hypothetical protein U0470_05205 [Anaerolineae bacterium]